MLSQMRFQIAQCLEGPEGAAVVSALQLMVQWLYCVMRWARPSLESQDIIFRLRPTSWWALSLEIQKRVLDPRVLLGNGGGRTSDESA